MAKSSLMPNYRHALVKIHGVARPLSQDEAKNELKKAMLAYFGVEGCAQVLPRLMKYDEKKREMTIRVMRGEERRFVAACALTSEFAGAQARLETLKISGTIAKLPENEEGAN